MDLDLSSEEIKKLLEEMADAAEPYGPEELAFDDPNSDPVRRRATLAALALGRIKPS